MLAAIAVVAGSRALQRTRAASALDAFGVTIGFFWNGPLWFQELIGASPFDSLGRAQVGFDGLALSSAQLKKSSELLAQFHSIEVLAFAGPDVNDTWLQHFQHVPRLEILLLENTSVTDAGLEMAAKWKHLEIVSLHGNPQITRPAVERIKKLRPDLGFLSDVAE
jgi:hypothetical protein